MRTVHRVILSVFTLGVIVQFFLAGLGVFRVQHGASSSRFDHVFEPHRVLGNVLLIVALLVLVAALVGRLGRGQALLGLVLTLLVFLQSVLANAGPSGVRATPSRGRRAHPRPGRLLHRSALA